MADQCFCLKWNNYQSNVVGDFKSLLEQEEFVDVTLACEGRRLKAHRLMLSACSNYFKNLLKENPSEHPIIFLRDVHFWELESIMDFIYNGQVNVMQDQLPSFIRTAEALQIKGLAAVNNNIISNNNNLAPHKMYDLKHIQSMLLRPSDELKNVLPTNGRISNHHHPSITSSLLSQDANKILPPLIHPNKRFRCESSNSFLGPSSQPYKDVLSPKHSPNHTNHNLSPNRFAPLYHGNYLAENGIMPNNQIHVGQDLSSPRKENNEPPLDLKSNSPPTSKHDKTSLSVNGTSKNNNNNCPTTSINGQSAFVKDERLTPPPEAGKGHLDPSLKIESNGDTRSNSPGDEKLEIEEDRSSSHDGSLDGFKCDWNADQASLLSISVNEAGLPICKVCGKVFKHQGSLVAHYQVHQQRTKCPVCKKVLSRHYHMKVHLLTVHKVPDSEIEGLLRSQNIA